MTIVNYSLFFRLMTYDLGTANHSIGVANMAAFLCNEMKLSDEETELIYQAALFHDIGKLKIPLEILRAPRALTDEEKEQVKMHPEYGEEIAQEYGLPSRVCQYIRQHHERIDGTGYPDGIKGEDLPLGARIIAVCDVLQAMLQQRSYKEAFSKKECKTKLMDSAGILDWDIITVALIFWDEIIEAGRSQELNL